MGRIAELCGEIAEAAEEVLDVFRDAAPPARRGFLALKRRLMDQGIAEEMQKARAPESDDERGDGDE